MLVRTQAISVRSFAITVRVTARLVRSSASCVRWAASSFDDGACASVIATRRVTAPPHQAQLAEAAAQRVVHVTRSQADAAIGSS